MNYIAIDGGTTNTRVALLCGAQMIDAVKIPFGAKAAIGNRERLQEEIASAIQKLRTRHPEVQVSQALACGMLTSEFGLMEIPHVLLPAGLPELHNSMERTEMFGLPIAFVPGVKYKGQSYASTDVMRGEECELFGILAAYPQLAWESCVMVLPGSHSKHIYMNRERKIDKMITCMTGEMIFALSQHTVLKSAIDLGMEALSEDYLRKGYEMSREAGLNAALMKVRILKNMFQATDVQCYSFFMGAVLQPEIDLLRNGERDTIVLAGKRQIREAMKLLLTDYSKKQLIVVNDETVDASVVYGMKQVFEYAAEQR